MHIKQGVVWTRSMHIEFASMRIGCLVQTQLKISYRLFYTLSMYSQLGILGRKAIRFTIENALRMGIYWSTQKHYVLMPRW